MAEMMKPLTTVAKSNILPSIKMSTGTAKAFEGITQQNHKLFESMNIKINSSMAEMMKPLTAVAKSKSLFNQQQVTTAQILKSYYPIKSLQELATARRVTASEMEEQLIEEERLEEADSQKKKEKEFKPPKDLKEKKKNIPKFSLSIETMYSFFPEDWRSNVEVRIQRQKKKGRSGYLIWFLTVRYFMELFWAAIEVGWDNLWLPNEREIE